MKRFVTLVAVVFFLTGCHALPMDPQSEQPLEVPAQESVSSTRNKLSTAKEASDQGMLLVLSAPSVFHEYYAPAFEQIVDFHVNYALSVQHPDKALIIVDADTKPHYAGKVPEEMLLVDEVYDIWIRDFGTIRPESPVQFVYSWASMSLQESEEVQQSLRDLVRAYELEVTSTDLIVDGGNMVDNYAGKFITTTRFLEDNALSYEEGKEVLQEVLNASEVAILEPDEDVLAHSDGMVMWIDEDTLLVNDYSAQGEDFRQLVLDELEFSFPDTTIIEVPVDYRENKPGEWEGFSSACGVNVNAVMTYENLYVPVFGMEHEQEVLETIRQHTSKNVVEIKADGVCAMGGSVRCLTWQLTGRNAERLLSAAAR